MVETDRNKGCLSPTAQTQVLKAIIQNERRNFRVAILAESSSASGFRLSWNFFVSFLFPSPFPLEFYAPSKINNCHHARINQRFGICRRKPRRCRLAHNFDVRFAHVAVPTNSGRPGGGDLPFVLLTAQTPFNPHKNTPKRKKNNFVTEKGIHDGKSQLTGLV